MLFVTSLIGGEEMGSRYVKDFVLDIDQVYVENAIQEYLRGNNFTLVTEKGESYYKTGGVMLPLRGFKYGYQNGTLHLEAWNGKIGKEMNIGDGKLLGAASKVPYYNSILKLLDILNQARVEYQQPYGQTQTPIHLQSSEQVQDPVYAQQFEGHKQAASAVADEIHKANNRNAKIAFWLSIASLIFLFNEKFSLVANLASLTLAVSYGLKSQKRGLAITAIIINSIVILIALAIIFVL
jgi:hypothetical protein